jgi:hypothetical protein
MLYLRPVQGPEGCSPTTGLAPRKAGNLSGGHSHTQNKLKRTNWKDPNGNGQGNVTTDAIFTLKQILEKRREFNLPMCILFIDYEKTYDNANREKRWQILNDENIPFQLQKAIQSLYKNSKICIKYYDGQLSDPVNTNKGVKQGYGLSPDLFNIYINKIIEEWKQKLTMESS